MTDEYTRTIYYGGWITIHTHGDLFPHEDAALRVELGDAYNYLRAENAG